MISPIWLVSDVIDKVPGDYYVGDVSDKTVLEAFAEKVINESGGIDYLINNALPLMKGIGSTSEYLDYSASIINRHFTPHMRSSTTFPGYTPDYSDDYINELEDVFCYSVFEEGDLCIVKLKVEYIKHNTTIAFPSVILYKMPLAILLYNYIEKFTRGNSRENSD